MKDLVAGDHIISKSTCASEWSQNCAINKFQQEAKRVIIHPETNGIIESPLYGKFMVVRYFRWLIPRFHRPGI